MGGFYRHKKQTPGATGTGLKYWLFQVESSTILQFHNQNSNPIMREKNHKKNSSARKIRTPSHLHLRLTSSQAIEARGNDCTYIFSSKHRRHSDIGDPIGCKKARIFAKKLFAAKNLACAEKHDWVLSNQHGKVHFYPSTNKKTGPERNRISWSNRGKLVDY